ncbi:MAG: 4'-phosphopantetheinyl transferase superfamily protein [Gemmataceae bacterium]
MQRGTSRVVVASCDELAGRPVGGEVRVWVVPLDSPPVSEADLLACLSAEERDRADRYKVRKPRHQFVTGRGLLRRILGNCLALPPHEVPIGYTGAGKPILDCGTLHFNVTHTDQIALIALAGRPVGVDVEQVRSLANPDGLVQRFFSAAECASYRMLPPELRPHGFFRAWTCKEALIKAVGLSVTNLGEFDVELHPHRPAALLETRHPALMGMSWELEVWEPVAGFAAAIALAGSPETG